MSGDERDYEDDLAQLRKILRDDLTHARYEIMDAIDEDRDGVFALARRLAASPNVTTPAGLFISCIRKGEHRGATEVTTGPLRLSPREAFEKFFDEYREWLLDVASVDENRAIEWALDYAVGAMSARQPMLEGQPVRLSAYERDQSALSLEDDKRRELGRARPVTTGEEQTRMRGEWILIGLCLHDPAVSAMHNALMAQCAIPREPGHPEARDAREALVEEIRERGVKPRPLPGPMGEALVGTLESLAR